MRDLLAVVTVVALTIESVRWCKSTGCPPLLEGSEQFPGTFRAVVAETL